MGKNARFAWQVLKNEPAPLLSKDRLSYPHHKRACRVFNRWLSGFFEEELSEYFEISVREIKFDIMHVCALLPVRVIIDHHNNRNRILVQRTESEAYRRLLGEALRLEATEYLKAGINPATVLREYREAVAMVSKPGPLLAFQQNIMMPNAGNGSGIRSFEDVVRKVLALQAENESQTASMPEVEDQSPPEQHKDSLDGPDEPEDD